MRTITLTLGESRYIRIVFGAFLVLLLLAFAVSGHCADVMIDQTKTFQTIEGWGYSGGNLGGQLTNVYRLLGPAIADPVNFQMIDYLADDLGLTGTRISEIGERPDGQGTDNGDCDVVDWTKFQPGPYADADGKYMKYFRDRILAGGAQPSFYSSTMYAFMATGVKPWVLNHPGERAQQIWANALYWRDHYGIEMNYAVVANEPTWAGSLYTWPILQEDIKALGPRLAAHGLKTRIQFPEAVDPQTAWSGFIFPLQFDQDLWNFVGRVSYHRYGNDDPFRANMRDFGHAKGIPTGQTELEPATVSRLFTDLTQGGVSYWEMAYSFPRTLVPNPGQTTFTPSMFYFSTRQVTHYVRPGAVRIGASSSAPTMNVVAFTRKGAVTTVIWNNTAPGSPATTVNVSGLPAGVYGASQSINNNAAPFTELGLHTVGADGQLPNLPIAGGGIITLYPYAGPNHPPTITTWKVNPGRVEPPASTATLSVTANDTELDPLTYNWSVTSQPAGAQAALAAAGAATTNVSGLTAPGLYVFNVDVRDGVNTSAKKVYLVVGGNQPPVFGVSGLRLNAPYGYEMDYPGDAPLHAQIALPTPPAMLSANISDLENDALTAQWSLVSQPDGAAVTLGDTKYIFASFRSIITGMTVPGDYVFQLDVHDPTHTSTLRVMCTVHPANTPPVINAITANPSDLILPASASELSATTSDPENDLLRHWWAVKSTPQGAKPVFDHQGLPKTTVSNLVLPGNYVFTLRAFDDLHMTTRDVVVRVAPMPDAPVIISAPDATVTAGTAFAYTIAATNNPTGYKVGELPPGLTFKDGVIAGAPKMPGRWNILLSAVNGKGTGNGNLKLTVFFPAPEIRGALAVECKVNTPFNYVIEATNCPMSYDAVDLPAGLTLNKQTGLISGTPTAEGAATVTLSATNQSGVGTAKLALTVIPK